MDLYLPTLTVAGILAFLTPLAVTALGKLTWSNEKKQLLALAFSLVISVFTLLVTDGFAAIPHTENPVTYIGSLILMVVGVTQLAYQLVWKPTGVDAKLAAASASESEKAKFLNQNTIIGTVDSTESATAAAVVQTYPDESEDDVDETPVDPDYQAKH